MKFPHFLFLAAGTGILVVSGITAFSDRHRTPVQAASSPARQSREFSTAPPMPARPASPPPENQKALSPADSSFSAAGNFLPPPAPVRDMVPFPSARQAPPPSPASRISAPAVSNAGASAPVDSFSSFRTPASGESYFAPPVTIPNVSVAPAAPVPLQAPSTGPSDSAAPGDSFAQNGQRITVEETETLPDGEEVLNVSVTDDEGPRTAFSSKTGFTREQELFRTKWGWEAFDQAGRNAAYGN